MSEKRELFKPDRNQLIAVIAMIVAVFLFGAGEMAFGAAFFFLAAVFSLGGLFWRAHRQDQADAEGSTTIKDGSARPASKD